MKKLIIMGLMMFVAIYGGYVIGGSDDKERRISMDRGDGELKIATFAGGCFWCMEPPFQKLTGVYEVVSGYSGGKKKEPTYKEVSSGVTGHAEAVQIHYDPAKVSYEELLDIYWRQIDPTDGGGSFVDRGNQYRSAIFYHTEEQRRLAEESKERLNRSGRYDRPVVTEIVAFEAFYRAEEYHQDYSEKNPVRYKIYRYNSGRDQYLGEVWGDDKEKTVIDMKESKEELRKRLTPLQYKVTQEDGTERAYDNAYWDNKAEGIYVDIVSGEPLFSSTDKYDSRTGWPSFTKPIGPDVVVEKEDRGFFMVRTEVRSRGADSHLGHLFNDGPEPTGLRYCINSAALRFVPKEDLQKEGYDNYTKLFE